MTHVLDGLAGLLIDLDGVVYTGGTPIPGSIELLLAAKARGFPFLLATNNSTATAHQVAERIRGMGADVQAADVVTSSEAAAAYVLHASGAGARVLPVGEAGLVAALTEAGLQVVDGSDCDAEWVVAGLDRQFDYARLSRATRAIRGGAGFVATNTDALLPVEGGGLLPGAGSIVAAIAAASGVVPVVTGKPEAALFLRGLERLGNLPPHSVAMVGDRIDTDVVGAQAAGLRTILVLTGVSTLEEAVALDPPPDAILPNLAAVADLLGWNHP